MKVKKMNKKEYIAVMASLALIVAVGVSFGGNGNSKSESKALVPKSTSYIGSTLPIAGDTAKIEIEEVAPVGVTKNQPAEPAIESPAATAPTQAAPKATEPVANPDATEKSSANTEDEYDEAGLFDSSVTFMWPVDGEIAMDFSSDTVVYDPTLDQFRTNDSVCILAEEGTAVACAASGTVSSITDDYEKGKTVVVDHGDGWTTTYSPIKDNLAVKVGDSIKKGEKVGTVAAPTKFGTAMGSHLEFKLCQGAVAINPNVALAN